ncbi:DarT1-associated NADAR antitoxin family protein [Bacillus sp. M6-12]|uniref:DarT1-associated NADAR antitoxin family protein n=1 Tax=Bacillus sp. M6-12 TaxID=2054166 RepID=UPI0015E13A6E|nr:macro domain-containing protein [Bacillus sp. M6-12]
MKSLECSSKGDKRFSALFAKVEVYGKFDSIENHYQLSKRMKLENGELFVPKDWKELKGKKVDCFEVNGIVFPEEYLTQYYKLLWVKYLDANPSLVAFASGFDEFTDMFKGNNSVNCQADVIKQYVKEGRASIMKECQPLIQVLKRGGFVIQVTGDLLKSKEHIIGHQTNCLGIMGGGIARLIKELYPEIFKPYQDLCFAHKKSRSLLGECQLVQTNTEGKYVANLFGQHEISRTNQETEYDELEKALFKLKEVAKEKKLSVGLPWQLGSGLGGGDWNEVKSRIEKVFIDYPATIYKLPGAK